MPVYCIKTADIPAEELNQWHDIAYALESPDITSAVPKAQWCAAIFQEELLILNLLVAPTVISISLKNFHNTHPVLTLEVLKTLMFLRLTGDSNENNTLSLLTSTEN